MIVCICKRARREDIEQAIGQGANSVEEIGQSCGAGTGCGRCREFIHDMLDDAGLGCGAQGGSCPDCPGKSLPLAS